MPVKDKDGNIVGIGCLVWRYATPEEVEVNERLSNTCNHAALNSELADGCKDYE